MSRRISFFVIVAAAWVVGGCASAPHRIAEEEISADWSGKAYSNLLVIGVYDDRPYRIGAETSFVEMLNGKSIAATPSYDVLPNLGDLDSNEKIAGKLATMEHDGVLAVATLDEGYDYDVGDYFATRGMVYLLGGRPGAGTDMGSFIAWAGSGHYSLYVSLWDAETVKPAWQTTTNSQTTGSESGDTKALAEFVVETLRGKGLLEASKGDLAPAP